MKIRSIQTNRYGRWAVATLTAAILLGACGSSDDGGDTASPADDGAGGDTETTADGGATADPTSAEAEVTLTYSGFAGEASTMMQGWSWYAQEVTERTDGAVQFESFYSGSLLGAVEGLAGVKDGRVDAVHIGPQYHATEFPLMHVIGIPFLSTNAAAQSYALRELYQTNELLQAEFEAQGIRPLTFQVIGPSMLGTNTAIETLDDLDGLNIRSTGLLSLALETVGANTEGLEAGQVYEAMQRGVLDGYAALPFDLAPALALQEVTTHITDPGTGLYNIALDTISTAEWESLSEDTRAVMVEVADEYLDYAVPLVEEAEKTACDVLLEADVDVSVLPEAEVAEWEELVGDSAEVEWIDKATAAGISEADAEAFLAQYRELLEKYEGQTTYESGMSVCAERA